MDFVQEIESYSPQTGQGKPVPSTVNAPQQQADPKGNLDPVVVTDTSEPEKQDAPKGWTRFFKQAYYQQYFQVTEANVLERLRYALVPPFNEEFIQLIKPNPDFYGPFWIMTTIVFLLGTIGNFSNYLLSKFSDGAVWQGYFFHLQFVRYAVIVVYSFGLGVPLTLFFMLKFLSFDKISFPELICVYGYANACFIPAVLLCVLPIGVLQWLLLVYALANSCLFLIVSIRKHIEGIKAKHAVIFGVIIALQLVFFLICKLYFISLIEATPVPSPADPQNVPPML